MQRIVDYFASPGMKNDSPLDFFRIGDCDLNFEILGCGRYVNLKDQKWLD
jgi:hypothetical protein